LAFGEEAAVKGWILPGALLASVFAVTRLPAVDLQTEDSDISIYGRYAADWLAAARQGESFHAVHRRRTEADIGQASPVRAATMEEYKTVEYPPLALAGMALPAYLVEDPFDGEFPRGLPTRYAGAYIGLMACCDAGVLLLVLYLTARAFPNESPWEKCKRCLVYVLCTWPLYGILYTRLDLGVALLVMASLALLVSPGMSGQPLLSEARCGPFGQRFLIAISKVGRQRWVWSFAVLALAIHLKLIPLVLAPLWILGAMPVATLQASWRRALCGLVTRGFTLGGFVVAILVAFYLWQGGAVLEFLSYHKDRGIEIESTYASLLLLLRPLGHEWEVYHSHGGINVRSALTPGLTTVATVLAVLLLLAVWGLFAALVWFKKGSRTVRSPLAALPAKVPDPFLKLAPGATVAQTWPGLVASAALLALLVSIIANKVFSPQYLLWVLPLVPLVPFRPVGRRLFFAGVFAACFLTMRIFPDCYAGEIVYVIARREDLPVFGGPTAYGAFLLLARNGLVVALTLVLAISFLQQLRRNPAAAEAASFQPNSYLPPALHRHTIPSAV
jgi:hypothetical protein